MADLENSSDEAMGFRWSIMGTGNSTGSPGALRQGGDDSGDAPADCEGVGDVLHWLLEHGPCWDVIDQTEEVTIVISPKGRS